MDSFLSAVHYFTGLKIPRGTIHPIAPASPVFQALGRTWGSRLFNAEAVSWTEEQPAELGEPGGNPSRFFGRNCAGQ